VRDGRKKSARRPIGVDEGDSVNSTEATITNLVANSKLPTFPSIAVRIMQLISVDSISFVQVADLLKTDASLTAVVLRSANSPMDGSRGEIKSIPLALVTLGIDRVSLLILTTAIFRMVPGSLARHVVRPWWRHNLATALLCRQLTPDGMVDEYNYMCGLLHSIGQLALWEAFPTQYTAVLQAAAQRQVEAREAERTSFGVDHCVLGAALLKKWNIPAEMIDAAAHHHDPGNGSSPFTETVSVACEVANHLGMAIAPHPSAPAGTLSPRVRELLDDERLAVDLTARVDEIEDHVGAA
jgi:HD-like signal output (HDOD) protein